MIIYIAEATSCDGCCDYYYDDWDDDDDATDGSGDDDDDDDGGYVPPDEEDDGAGEYSETNTQEEGVDEADFIKNAGSYIYILADNTFQIIDARPPEGARVLSRVELDGEPKKLYVYGDRALVYSSHDYIGYSYPYFAGHEALRQKNREIIDDSTVSDWMPFIQDTRYLDNGTTVTENVFDGCEQMFETGLPEHESFLTVLSFDMTELEFPQDATILGKPGAVYGHTDSLYLAARQEYSAYRNGGQWYFDNRTKCPEATVVCKFAVENDPAGVQYKAGGVVKGRVLNQFSMDEHEGFFRIATTTGHVPGPKVHNTLVIMQEDNGTLKAVSLIDSVPLLLRPRPAPSGTFREQLPVLQHGAQSVLDVVDPDFGSPSVCFSAIAGMPLGVSAD